MTTIIYGDTGYGAPINTEIGYIGTPYFEDHTILYIADLAASQPLAYGDLIEADLVFEVTNPNDPRPDSDYSELCSVCSYMFLSSAAALPVAGYVNHNDPDYPMISDDGGENAPFVVHHKRVVQHGHYAITSADTGKRYLVAVGLSEANASGMDKLIVEYNNESRMTYKITRGATSDGRTGNGSDLIPPPASAADVAPIALSFTASASNGTDLTNYSFSSLSLGSAAADRQMVVGIGAAAGSSRTVNSVLVAGVTASRITGAVGAFGSDIADLWSAKVSAGTTGNVDVNFSGSMARCTVGLWRMTGASAAHHSTLTVSTSTQTTVSGNIAVPNNGAVIAITRAVGSGSQSITWSGLTEDMDTIIESGANAVAGAHATPVSSSPLVIGATINGTGVASNALAAASWSPSS
jgi:hypothetical protein